MFRPTVVATHRLAVGADGSTAPLKMADGSVVQAGGCVKFVLQCGPHSDHIYARVFPGLHKEIILGMSWLVQAKPDINWRERRVQVQQRGIIQ